MLVKYASEIFFYCFLLLKIHIFILICKKMIFYYQYISMKLLEAKRLKKNIVFKRIS
jgi:hypothetical protein